MHGLTGSQEPRNWRTDDLLRVGDDLRHGREAGGRRVPNETRPGLRARLGLSLVGFGEAIAGEARRRQPCPDPPQAGGIRKTTAMRRASRPQ